MTTSPERGKGAIGFIFARGGSKGLPGKNLRTLGDRPLIAHAIETAKSCRRIERVVVSTDDEEIASVARAFGAETPFMRPPELASDHAPEWLAWRHAISWVQRHQGGFEVFVSLPATSPLRSVSDVERCIDCLLGDAAADIIVTGCEASRSPYFNMVKIDSHGYVSLAVQGHAFARRQDAPRLFDLTTVAYVARPDYILSASHMFDGNVRLVEVPRERALDIDSLLDFEFAEFLVSRRQS